MKLAILLIILSFSALADYQSEKEAIKTFEKEEFLNEKNYPPTKPGQGAPPIIKAFYDKLVAEPQSMKYFLVLTNKYRIFNLYKKDKAFALALESKFQGKKLGTEEWDKVMSFVGNNIIKDSNATHKSAMKDFNSSNAYFEKQLSSLKATSF